MRECVKCCDTLMCPSVNKIHRREFNGAGRRATGRYAHAAFGR